jgi:hypothetical protein
MSAAPNSANDPAVSTLAEGLRVATGHFIFWLLDIVLGGERAAWMT